MKLSFLIFVCHHKSKVCTLDKIVSSIQLSELLVNNITFVTSGSSKNLSRLFHAEIVNLDIFSIKNI
ncbi:hypothetical protein ACFLY2_01875 [Patescibacteria group bacterium]